MPTCCRTNRSQVARYGRTGTVRQFTVFAAISFLAMMIGAQTPVTSKTTAESAIEECKLQLPADAGYTSEGRTAADNATARSVFVIGPDKKIKASLTYPMSTGRNFDEILRLLDSCQLTAKQQVATPVNWKQGEPVVILPSISDEAAKEKYPDGWDAPLPYLRFVPQPK